MTPELTALTLAALLQIIQFSLYAVPANMELGTGYTMSPRDREPTRQMSDRTARLGRAFDNHFQGLLLFAIAAVVIHTTGQSSTLTSTCAWIYLTARIAYVPAYVLGWNPVRSYIWFAGFLATTLMLIASLI
jgi:uncharacterized MAPEG superfamily protein